MKGIWFSNLKKTQYMKSKVIKLLEKGLSTKLLSNLTESQIDTLYSKMGLSEVTMVSKTDSATIQKLKTERKPFEVYEKEVYPPPYPAPIAQEH